MSENDAVLIGWKEISTFLRISERKAMEWRDNYPDMPLWSERRGARVCADKETLAAWQRRLFSCPCTEMRP